MKTTAIIMAAIIMAAASMAQETVQPQIAVDVLDVKEKGIVQHVKDNWGKYLVGLAGIAGVEMAAENNDWLWHKPGSGDKGTIPPSTMDASAIEDNDFADINIVAGDYSPVNVTIDYYEDRQP